MSTANEIFSEILELHRRLSSENLSDLSHQHSLESDLEQEIDARTLDPELRERLRSEISGLGPLEELIKDPECIEILCHDWRQLVVDCGEAPLQIRPGFLSSWSFLRVFHHLCQEAQVALDLNRPSASGTLRGWRLQVTSECLTPGSPSFSLRRLRSMSATGRDLPSFRPKRPLDLRIWQMTQDMVRKRKNLLVVGPTGVGKTTIISALLQELENERVLILEDTDELALPNLFSGKLLARPASETLREIGFAEILRVALRLRPQRLVLGEIRGEEAKDFLLCLSSGHPGSVTSLHAQDARQALHRLELLVTMAAPEWPSSLVRELIFQSIHAVLVLGFNPSGERALVDLASLSSLEPFGIVTDSLIQKQSVDTRKDPDLSDGANVARAPSFFDRIN